MKSKKTIVVGLCVVVLLGLGAYLFMGGKAEQEINYETAKVQRATIGSTVTATGTIEPVTKVEVGTQVSGIISKIYVDYNSEVKKGQLIAELDRTNLMSELASAKSNLEAAGSDLSYQKANHSRMKTLHDKGLVSDDEYETARLSLRQAESTYDMRKEAVAKAQTNLGYAYITSPINGVILSKAVEEGQTVAAGFTTPTLFTIAQDLTDMRVIADVDEADIGDVAEGQKVEFTVDAYPNETFEGQVTQVRQEATTESNVVTYEVVISAPNPSLKLKPGLTANVTIHTLEQPNLLSVPTKALRFTPTADLLRKGDKIQDCSGNKKVWVREGNVIKAYAVQTGITNGTLTQIVSGVKEGVEVITEIKATVPGEEEAAAEEQERSPFAPGPRKKKK
ncbi:MAG: efflux RND transporter periplasmic adaptor subunit [Alloprevotella sp.]|nr:efflux RND transporter periplasmic adaptor subunit [Bacteroidales bacterium]MDD7563479.1 efflux RND transporter periplasmic adaptor subunit [Prevotellamassilia sp.]MDY2623521.1 efflux RND transporter periplasmic adaptor subunit [Alloprevotella sp.]MDY2779039.1 efflux RND transporter periplasmic adaptor subunit [Alloprevotella sp.]MDY4058269.1 efflux RND transporter periplasmic adaptor subunit [Alloprevotella sp.]